MKGCVRFAALSVSVIVAALLAMTWHNWIVVVGTQGFVPPGIYRCNVELGGVAGQERVRECYIGIDGTVYRRSDWPDGSSEESWFGFGNVEYLRRTVDPQRNHETHMRTFGDCWSGLPRDIRPPDGENVVVREQGLHGQPPKRS
jgi:hypothetical protein